MVNLTRIYTRTGDAGTTRLSDNSVAAKTDPRVQAYGHVDEANAMLGVAIVQPGMSADIVAVLKHIQNELFDCGADLSHPLQADDANSLRIIQPYVTRLERWCDQYSEGLPDLPSFVLPGGSPASAWLQVARTVVRRAERTGWAAASVYGNQPASEERAGGVNLLALAYLNRLSDLLFILARVAGQPHAEVLWVPGKDRSAPDPAALRQRDKITTAAPAAAESVAPEVESVTDEDLLGDNAAAADQDSAIDQDTAVELDSAAKQDSEAEQEPDGVKTAAPAYEESPEEPGRP